MKSNKLIPELSVSNLSKSLSFYTNLLEFKIEYSRLEEGFAFISKEGSQLMLDQIGKGRDWKTSELSYPLGRGINFQIEIDNVDRLLEKLKREGIKLFMDVEEKWYRRENIEVGNKQFLIQDPDGYLLRFYEDLGERDLN